MAWQLTRTVEPTSRAVTLDDVRDFVQVAPSVDHALLMRLVDTATNVVQVELDRQIVTATYKLELSGFPSVIRLPRPPLGSLTSVQYVDTDEATQTVDSAVYATLDDSDGPARIVQAYGQTWPSGLYDQTYPVIVNYTAGYSTVPEALKHSILIVARVLYEQRESGLDIPLTAKAIMGQFKHGTLYDVEYP